MFFFFFKQKTAYEMRISDWSSDVCSSDLATAAAWTASERASSSRPWAIAACASSSARRAWETSSAAYWSASAFPARATACRAVASSAVGGGRLAQAVSASTVANARTCRPDLICAKLVALGGSRSRGSAAIVISIRWNPNDSPPGRRGSLMEFGYFLKLVHEKTPSVMLLRHRPPVYTKGGRKME